MKKKKSECFNLVSEISSPAWAAGLALKEWWDGEAESWSIWCVRIIIDMCQKYYWCVSEILLICVRNIIDVSQKYHWCVSEIVLMCVGNIIDVLWKSYWCVFEILLTSTIVCNKRWTYFGQEILDFRRKSIWVICYCWGNSSIVEGRFSKWF